MILGTTDHERESDRYCILRINYPDVGLTYLLLFRRPALSLPNVLLEEHVLPTRYLRLTSLFRTSGALGGIFF